jgi:murein DD-endopeptidase MepM/ murein hydrolase activator NlpD
MQNTQKLTLSRGIATIILAVLTIFPLVTKASPERRNPSYIPIDVPVYKLKLPPLSTLEDHHLFKLQLPREIPEILDFIRDIEFDDLPEEYDIWSDNRVNPYQVDLKDMADTVKIDLSGFSHPGSRHITSDFGFRKWRFHYGIDLKVDKGDPVSSAFDGVVRITKRARDYGYYVVVRHFNGLETLYAHLSRILVNPGDTVKSGETVGLGGSTGRSTGNHLHFETRYLGNPINPNDIVNFNNYSVHNNILQLTAKHFEYKKEIAKIRYWTIRKGDTLGRIAQRTGVSISKLCSLNGIKRTSILRIGRRLRYT